MATPELAIQSLPARSNPGSRSLGHFTLQQVQCMGKTSPSKTFTSLLWVTHFCSACGSVTKSTAVATLQGLLVVLVSSALVSLFSSKLQISGIGWASANRSPLRFLKAAHELVHVVVFRRCGTGCHYYKSHWHATPYCSITLPFAAGLCNSWVIL